MGNTESHSTNVYEMVIKSSSELETLLETKFGATGRGLHEKITSVQSQLSPPLVKRMRYLATVRNKLVHNSNAEDIPSRETFIKAYETSKQELQTILEGRQTRGGRSRSNNTNQNDDCHIL